jgi:hypothetical protein
MANKFHGPVGFNTGTVESPAGSGVWKNVIVERNYYGDVLRNSRQTDEQKQATPDLSVSVSISIVADPYANETFFAIRYIKWAGSLWQVTNVQVQTPRLILTLGGVYNGPTPEAP